MFFCAYISIPSQRPLCSRTQVQAHTGIDGTLERITFRHQHAYLIRLAAGASKITSAQ